jgi:predicted MFS family arabinose efflux permease
LIFGINIVPIAVTLWLMRSLKPVGAVDRQAKVDGTGASLSVLGVAAITYALTEQPNAGWGSPMILVSLVVGVIAMGIFLWYERRAAQPMLHLRLFAIRNFSVGNIATVFVYGGLTVSGFLITIFIQQVAGFSALAAGLTFLPVTAVMFLLSTPFGKLAGRVGPRLFMALGPAISGAGMLLMLGTDESVQYWVDLFPGVVVFGLGLSVTVAPLTATILGAVSKRESGIGSAINNAISRLAGLVAVAAVGIIVGREITVAGFHAGLWFVALLLFAGGAVSALGISNAARPPDASK